MGKLCSFRLALFNRIQNSCDVTHVPSRLPTSQSRHTILPKIWRWLKYCSNTIELYEARNKPEKAKEWQEKLPQTEAVEE